MILPEIRYARSGALRIAYQVVGNGTVDLVFVPAFISNLDLNWEDARYSRLVRRLSAFARVMLFDKRGTGLSDRVEPQHPPGLEARIDDVRAVMDAAGSGRAVLLGAGEGAAISMLYAATYPARTRALVLYGAYAHFRGSVMDREALGKFIQTIESSWGSGASLPRFAPARANDPRFRTWWARLERQSASPTAAVALARMNAQIDVRDILSAIRVPTLVMHRRDDVWAKLSGGRQLAQRIRGARFVELSGRDHAICTGEIDRAVDEIEEFVTGTRPMPSCQRMLVTMMIARLVSPERLAGRLGDGPWHERLDQFHQATADAIAQFGGDTVVAGAEEIFARFDGPARAIRCALRLRDAADALDLELSAAVHAGEVEIHDGILSGYTVHVAERIAAYAKASEVLVSGVVSDLVPGSGLHFVERPIKQPERGDGRLRLYSVMVEQHLEPKARHAKSPRLDELSRREREVLAMVADGLSNAAIAACLRLSDQTVKRHVANILLKLDLPTRAAAAALAARQNSG
jgi:pimeloyl-ACP methyl ester carboxylesterase/DNA-binding CsgD family transcriptional regulator